MEFTLNIKADQNLLSALIALSAAFTGNTQQVPASKATALAQPDKKIATAVAETVDGITTEQVRLAVQAKSTAGKKDDVKALLSEFGASNVTTLAKEHYAAFKEKVDAL